jgi:Druantia protein DruA
MSRDAEVHLLPNPERERLISKLRGELVDHIASLGLDEVNGQLRSSRAKELIRASHLHQRVAFLDRERRALASNLPRLLSWFADGREVSPGRISPVLIPAQSDHATGDLFRLATTLWSVPVSRGFGRRMRYLVIDSSIEKLIGVLALGDPVFNLRVRDSWVGWDVRAREIRLASVLDAYVVGAVPPYSALLGGKLVASLIGSAEISRDFDRRYGEAQGIISGEKKHSRLALVTVSSALGRSSIYNRLALPGLVDLRPLGMTEGWGHFQVPDAIFADMRRLLTLESHAYAQGHQFGDGPNWRIRVIRESLKRTGLDTEILRHGIPRQVFAMPLADNWRPYLRGHETMAELSRPSLRQIVDAALERWIIPRSRRRPEYRDWTQADARELIARNFALVANTSRPDPTQLEFDMADEPPAVRSALPLPTVNLAL